MTSRTISVAAQREPELAGQTVVVIGGSAGIGLATARRARAEGADVIITGRNLDRLTQAAQDVGAQRTAAFDANDNAALESFFSELPAPIDHVLVTAGGLALMTTLQRDTSYLWPGIFMFVVGVGSGMFNSRNTAAMMGTVAPHRRGIAAGARVLVYDVSEPAVAAVTAAHPGVIVVASRDELKPISIRLQGR